MNNDTVIIHCMADAHLVAGTTLLGGDNVVTREAAEAIRAAAPGCFKTGSLRLVAIHDEDCDLDEDCMCGVDVPVEDVRISDCHAKVAIDAIRETDDVDWLKLCRDEEVGGKRRTTVLSAIEVQLHALTVESLPAGVSVSVAPDKARVPGW